MRRFLAIWHWTHQVVEEVLDGGTCMISSFCPLVTYRSEALQLSCRTRDIPGVVREPGYILVDLGYTMGALVNDGRH